MPVAALHGIRVEVGGEEAHFVVGAANLGDGLFNVGGEDHGGGTHLGRVFAAKVVNPVVVGPGHGACVPAVLVGDTGDRHAPGGEDDGEVEPLGVHGLKLGHGVEAAVYGGFQVLVAVLGLYLAAACFFLVDLDVGIGEEGGNGLALNGHVHDELVFGHPNGREVPELGVDIVEPHVPGLVDVHVAVHDLEAVFGHRMSPFGVDWGLGGMDGAMILRGFGVIKRGHP